MAFDLASVTSEIRQRAPRIILLGVEKIGKSTFASYTNMPVMLPIKGEEGLDDPEIQKRAKVLPVCNSFSDVMGWIGSLYTGDHPHQTTVLDSASTLEPLIHAGICRGSNASTINEGSLQFGVGTDKAGAMWRQLTEGLDALRADKGMASIIIGHVKVKRFDDPNGESYDQYQWDIHHKAASILYRWADCILFCNTKVVVTQEKLGFHKDNVRKVGREIQPGSRFLYTQKRPSHPGGGRGVYGRLPYEMTLNWGSFQDAVAAEMAKQTP